MQITANFWLILQKNEFVMIKGKACKIVDMSTSKTGKHGHAKVHMVALDIFGELLIFYEDFHFPLIWVFTYFS